MDFAGPEVSDIAGIDQGTASHRGGLSGHRLEAKERFRTMSRPTKDRAAMVPHPHAVQPLPPLMQWPHSLERQIRLRSAWTSGEAWCAPSATWATTALARFPDIATRPGGLASGGGPPLVNRMTTSR